MGSDSQIVMTFRQLSQIWWELALHYFPVDCFGGIQFGGDGQTIFTTAGYLRFGGNWHHIVFWRIVLGLIIFRIAIKFNTESEYNSTLQIGMALSIK